MPWLQLIRWQNLLIILLTQWVAWWCVILPGSPEILNALNFCCLALSTMLIAAAGYIINDYFDIKIDAVNKPEKMVLEKIIPRKQAIAAHFIINITALALAGYVAAQAHHYEWLLLQASCILLLWFYSTNFKRQYITGNITVALLTSLTIFALYIYEPIMQRNAGLPVWVLAVYAYFAFLLTWIREIVKDMEDLKGDEAGGCVTMPVKRGLEYATRFAIALSFLAIIPLIIASAFLFMYNYKWLSGYLIVLLIVPLIVWSVFISKNTAPAYYHKASSRLKLIMLLGICSLLVYHLNF